MDQLIKSLAIVYDLMQSERDSIFNLQIWSSQLDSVYTAVSIRDLSYWGLPDPNFFSAGQKPTRVPSFAGNSRHVSGLFS